VDLIKMEIDLLQVVMIELVKYGKLKLGIYYIRFKDIKMLYILWRLMYHLGIKLLLFFRDRVATGSFDRTAKLWDANTGACLHTFAGHQN
jgi:WD40 repeat protein